MSIHFHSYAPWCPACKNNEEEWNKFAEWSKDLDVKVAQIDVNEHAGLSGRFLITRLPSFYHVKDGIFRYYRGESQSEDLIDFIDEKKYNDIEPMPWYQDPKSVHMSVISSFFEFSMFIRSIHEEITTRYGIPEWGSFVIFAVATILIGIIAGIVLVIMCDHLPFSNRPYVDKSEVKSTTLETDPKHDQEEESDVILDDTQDNSEDRPRRRRPKATTD
ncbi:DgyrCDS7292 [Dimorphilus gyrociliatus]|uniref:DgyrCDS7292 n=1 Tax=Dimorphilus gyrociliatus TaxID=2664684 RepID=A0A7I8VT88_9ANNE|nr:DgyrCDS7292 [Dimorphilus gyrociliatus]